jgi:tetraacyldisaccharide 4'-kinase
VYGGIVAIRNAAFEGGFLKQERAGVPVISVGNLAAGGTGKTPVVEHIAERLIARGLRVAVVSRGYRRSSGGTVVVADGARILTDARHGGDEPLQIARRVPGVIVVVGERRVDAARTAVRDFRADVVVMDDGFQHRYLKRDFDIVLLDASRVTTNEPLLPAGLRREPLTALRRADLVLFTRVPEVWSPPTTFLRVFRGPTAGCRHVIHSVRRLGDPAPVDAAEARGHRYAAMSGIANHRAFVEQLVDAGFPVVNDRGFPDHHTFTTEDLRAVVRAGKAAGANAVMVTEKDAVRLEDRDGPAVPPEVPIFVLRVGIRILWGEEHFAGGIERCLQMRAA